MKPSNRLTRSYKPWSFRGCWGVCVAGLIASSFMPGCAGGSGRLFRDRSQPAVVSSGAPKKADSLAKSKAAPAGTVHTVAKPAAETMMSAPPAAKNYPAPPKQVAISPPPAVPVTAEPTSFGRMATSERMDELLVLSPMLDEAQLLNFPTVVHHTSSLAVAAPGRLRRSESGYFERVLPTHSWASSVLLVPHDKSAEIRWEPVTNGWATFDQIDPGSFSVYYLKESVPDGDPNRLPIPEDVLNGKRVPHRKLVVESDPKDLAAKKPTKSPAAAVAGREFYRQPMNGNATAKLNDAEKDLAAARRAKEKQIPETIRGLLDESQLHTDKGWVALEKGNAAAALREFRLAISGVANGIPATGWKLPEPTVTNAAFTWKEVIEGSESVGEAMRNKTLDSATAARIVNSQIGHLPQMGRALYGLAKTYDAMATQPLSTLKNSDQFALALCQASFLLDETQMRVANDLGVMCYNMGRAGEAAEYLSYASTYSDDPRISFNLGRVMWEQQEQDKARQQWQLGMNTRLAEKYSLLSMIQVQLSSEGRPISSEECRQLAEDLGKIIRAYGSQSPEATWAQAVLLRLELLAYEIRLNEPTFSARISVALQHSTPLRPAKPDSSDASVLPTPRRSTGLAQANGN